MSTRPIAELVVDDRTRGIFRVNQQAFIDPAILEQERRAIFDHCWLYACHESEVANPGDFVSRNVGGRPVIIVRDDEGQVRALFNRCAHRGNVVCREPAGNARRFSCFYHAWTYNLKGELVGVPGEDAYTPGFQRAELGLQSPRIENYRGLLFVCFDPAMIGLIDYLADAREYVDLMLDLYPDGAEIASGGQAYSMDANWKLLIENSMDGYHFATTHQRYLRQFLPDVGIEISPTALGGRGVAFANGHSMAETRTLDSPLGAAEDEVNKLRARLTELHGSERADRMCDQNRNLFIFPNLIMISAWRTIRTFYPVAPGYLEVNAWALLPRTGDKDLKKMLFDNFISFLGPGGFGTPDDVAALEGCQRGFAAVGQDHGISDISRGMGKAVPAAIDELQMRAFWRRWHALLKGETGPTQCADRIG